MNPFRRSSRRSARRATALVFAAAAVAALAMTALAVAKSTTLGVASAKLSGPSGSRTEPIAVNSKGVAVYELLPETTHHLLCTSSACLQAWPPVKVASGAKLTKGSGLSGKLGTLKRKGGFHQLTLNGHPLYTFIEDAGKKGVAAGDGLKAFGGTWHVFKEAGSTSSSTSDSGSPTPTSTAPMSTTTTSTTIPGY
jgi:predicted lipoprotein with Yx(FWY)xxD motif